MKYEIDKDAKILRFLAETDDEAQMLMQMHRDLFKLVSHEEYRLRCAGGKLGETLEYFVLDGKKRELI